MVGSKSRRQIRPSSNSYESETNWFSGMKAPLFVGSPVANITFVLPELDGANGEVLSTDGSGNYIRDKYNYNNEFLMWIDQFGNPIKYFLPPSNLGQQNFPRIRNFTYWFKFYGKKAYGAKVIFFILYSQGM